MARYFFDVDERGRVEEDTEGSELPDVQAVRQAAIVGARELMAMETVKGADPDGRAFSIRNSFGQLVLWFPFKDAIS